MVTAAKPKSQRRFDVVIYGASGYTGRLVAEHLVKGYAPKDAKPALRLALAGRNRDKLEGVRRELEALGAAPDLPILQADSFDAAALDALAADAKVVCTTVGPYAKYGAELVAACVRHGTDYCDLAGEVHFIRRMIDAHHGAAQEQRARIVCCCGYDSVPSDLGTLMLSRAMHEAGGQLDEVKLRVGKSRGGMSGGTAASMLAVLEAAKADPSLRKLLADPYALNPEGQRAGPDGADQRGVHYDADFDQWTAPFVMAAINTRVVRRSQALLGFPDGPGFRYSEAVGTGSGPRGLVAATALTAGLGAFVTTALTPARALLERTVLPAPGEGPSREARERGFFRMHLIGKGKDGKGQSRVLRGSVEGQGDPGYGATARMLGEAAACLALDDTGAETLKGGVLTPATAMGEALLARLRASDISFRVEGTQPGATGEVSARQSPAAEALEHGR